ncbi:MAG TPA: hypothetical protein P5056_01955 [Candidatus Paceibacterota bacterium]|nr:hypothetical protein [Candidatus Paceibacterota bacterium]
MIKQTQNGGFIKLILLFVVGIIVLSYFGFNLREILNSDAVKNNFLAVWDFLSGLWTNYCVPLFSKFFTS